jgi:type IV pilus assembly protein PilA
MKKQQGFTLIELMIVIAIVGVLASLATSILTDYTTRAKLAEVMVVTRSIKLAQEEYYHTNRQFGVSVTSLGGDLPIPYGTAYATDLIRIINPAIGTPGYRGSILVELKYTSQGVPAEIADKTVLLKPEATGGTIRWTCPAVSIGGMTPVPAKYLPKACLPKA